MLLKNLTKWSSKLGLWEAEWGLTQTQSVFWSHKQKNTKHKLIFTNWLAKYDYTYAATSKHSWEYYYRRLNEVRLLWEWHRFVALWQRLKWKKRRISLLLYTDVFDDYPLIKHLSKKTDESYSVGWYSGLTSNRRKLLKFRYSYLLGKTEISTLPSIVILFSAFYSITKQFLKELGAANTYIISFVSIGDYHNIEVGSYTIFMTKTYVNYYYYYLLLYQVLTGQATAAEQEQQDWLYKKKMKVVAPRRSILAKKKNFLSTLNSV